MSRIAPVLVFVLLATLLSSVARASNAETSAAHALCRMSWASQPVRLNDCVDAQIAGAKSVVRWLDWAKKSSDPAALHIISTFEECSAWWTPDYAKIDACLREGTPLAPPVE